MIIPLINIIEDFLLVILLGFLANVRNDNRILKDWGKKRRFASDVIYFEKHDCESPLLPLATHNEYVIPNEVRNLLLIGSVSLMNVISN
jgi:hypothetical protein